MESALDEPPSLFLAEILAQTLYFFSFSGLLLLLLLFLSAMISGSEVAFFSLTHSDIKSCREGKTTADRKILQLIQKPKLLLASILILNNFVNIAIVTLSTFVVWEAAGTRSPEEQVLITLTAAVTFAIVFFGEIIPKVYANQNNLRFARLSSHFLFFMRSFTKPLAFILMNISNVVETRIQKKAYNVSVEELSNALEIAATEETTEEEKDILRGIVTFGTLSVTQVMVPRLDITAVDIEDDFHQLMDKINKCGYSRIPVYSETIDKIEGILYIKDLLPYLNRDEEFKWTKLLRPGYFVPESKKIDALLKDFQDKRVHMAIVVDEYGGTSGLITLEDIIEEIVGEINDEFDEEDVAYNKLDENTYVFEGKTSLNDFCKIINIEPEVFEEVKGESESLGGLILEISSKLPRAGEKIYFDKFVFTVVAVDARRIKRVRVFINEPSKTNFNEISDQ